jgi:apolipoprotein N-acyltransferase
LKFFSLKVFGRFPLAILAGLLLASAFPKIGIAGFAWIAPGLMLAAALGKRGAESFRIGYVAGLAHYLASLYWLLLIPYRWHGIPLGPAFGWIALSAYLALFPATWVWLAMRISECEVRNVELQNTPDAAIHNSPFTTHFAEPLNKLASWSWPRRIAWTFSCAAIWVALEMILARFLGGFPWNLLGASQYRILPLIQLASLTGVYGISFLVVWTSVSLLCAAAVIFRKPNVRSVWLTEMIFPTLAVAATFAFGMYHIGHVPRPLRDLKITLVQPAIPQTLIWDPASDMDRFRELMRLSEQAVTNETDVLIWPEAAIPKMLRYEDDIREPILNFARRHRVWMIVGSDDAEPAHDSSDTNAVNYFNASFLISPNGEIADRYCKRDLVIFGEYIPLSKWLPFLKWFTPIDGGFTPGEKVARFAMPNLEIKTSTLICFEDVFPGLARDAARGDTDFLVNITNDGWFGESVAQWQQAASACFRAVENNLPLVRCANTGISCWIDAAGRFREIFSDKNGSVYGAGFMTFELPIVENREPTFYHEHGDWFGWACVGFSVAFIAGSIAKKVLKSEK